MYANYNEWDLRIMTPKQFERVYATVLTIMETDEKERETARKSKSKGR